MSKHENVLELTSKLSDDARHICLLMSLHWPHEWKMGASELTFQNSAKRPMIRVWKEKNEGLTVGKDSAVSAAARAKLVEQYKAQEDDRDQSLHLPFENLSPGDVFELVSLLLEGQSA